MRLLLPGRVLNAWFRLILCVLAGGWLHSSSRAADSVSAGQREATSPARLAILAEPASLAEAVDVLTVEFSRDPRFNLLERAEIQKVYREQKLSRLGQDSLQAGRLLGAEGLLVLEMVNEGAREMVQSRLVAVKPGVALGSVRAGWPLTNLVEWSRRIHTNVTVELPKLSVAAQEAIPISIVNIKSPLNTPESRGLEEDLKMLLVHRLSWEPELFVLERQHMREMSFEQDLKPEEESSFWSGRYVFEATLDREGYDPKQVTIDAQLIAPNHGAVTPIHVVGPRAELATVVRLLGERVLQALKKEPLSNPWRPLEEAERFYNEARWAYRWGILGEAQAAADSAWALGKRSKDFASLRVRVYADAVVPESSGLGIPMLPDGHQVKLALHSLDLFLASANSGLSDGQSPGCAWYELGLTSLRRATCLLDGFYQVAEARPGNEEELALLRERIRETVVVLQTNDASKCIINRSPKLEFLQWEQGGTWFERPEDSVPMFREVLEHGYLPEHLPRFAAWSWDDRKRLPRITAEFLRECRSARSGVVKQQGLYLSLLALPYDQDGEFHSAAKEFLDLTWENRAELFKDREKCRVLARAQELFENKTGDSPGKLKRMPEFLELRQRLRLDYLRSAPRWDSQVFSVLFPIDSTAYAFDDGPELVAALESYRSRLLADKNLSQNVTHAVNSIIPALTQRLSSELKSAPSLANQAPARTPKEIESSVQPTLVAKLISWKLARPEIESSLVPECLSLQHRGGRIWALLHYQHPNEVGHQTRWCYVSVDLETGTAQEFLFPLPFGAPNSGFEVLQDSLFASARNRIARYRFKEKTWETIPVPMENGAALVGLGGKLYLRTEESLLELNPETREVKVLASARRMPAVNELDAAWTQEREIFARRDGTLGVLAGRRLFKVLPSTDRVEPWATLPVTANWYGITTIASDDALVLLYANTYLLRHRLLAFWDESSQAETLLEHVFQREVQPKMLQGAFSAPHWKWPNGFPLAPSVMFAGNHSLWALVPRKARPPQGGLNEEPVAFEDNRHATLLNFRPDSDLALGVGLRFESAGTELDPFGYPPNPRLVVGAQLFDNAGALVIAYPRLTGHWLLSKTTLGANMKPLTSVPAEAGNAGGLSRVGVTGPGVGQGAPARPSDATAELDRIVRSREEAKERLMPRANAGDPEAQCQLGLLYESSRPGNPSEAVRWYTLAANQSHSRGLVYLGQCYLRGYGVVANEEHALELVRTAAKQNYGPALFALAGLYARGIGIGQQDLEPTISMLKLAAEKGSDEALAALAFRYEFGLGTQRDLPLAAQLYVTANAKGETGDPLSNGSSPVGGITSIASPERSWIEEYWPVTDRSRFRKAVLLWHNVGRHKDAGSALQLGEMYAIGQDAPRSPMRAWPWFAMAQDLGADKAASRLKQMQSLMTSEELATSEQLLRNLRNDLAPRP